MTRPADQLLLALFILGGALASHLASGTEQSAETSAPESKRRAQLVVSKPYSEKRAS